MRAAVGDEVRLGVLWWTAEEQPAAGDGLLTKTGRKYLILRVVGRKRRARREASGFAFRTGPIALECVVLPRAAAVPGRWFQWSWAPRRR